MKQSNAVGLTDYNTIPLGQTGKLKTTHNHPKSGGRLFIISLMNIRSGDLTLSFQQ